MRIFHIASPLLALMAAGCIHEPPRYTEVFTVKAGEAAPAPGSAPGIIWRLDENELKALSPAPIVPAPPPPKLASPPRPNAEYPAPMYYYGRPVY
ncbi:MAG TPA: hypothetical protein VM164_03555 [Burkholderiales bacterium]|nr:hypothetical protein [Burkholderiales bacterium]